MLINRHVTGRCIYLWIRWIVLGCFSVIVDKAHHYQTLLQRVLRAMRRTELRAPFTMRNGNR